MDNVILILILLTILALAIGYIVKKKKSGAKCIGCPHSSECHKQYCTCSEEEEK